MLTQKTFILVSVIILLLYCLSYILPDNSIHSYNTNDIHYKILLNDVLHQCKTGDLILFSSIARVPLNVITGHNKYSHTGFVVIINNKPYVYELVNTIAGYDTHKNMKDFNKPVQLNSLYDRIKYYSGNCYLASLNKEMNYKQVQLLEQFMLKNDNYTFTNYYIWFPFVFSTYTRPNERFCHEFIADILDKVQISSEPMKQNKFNLTKKMIDLCDGHIYSYPIQIIPNDLLINKNINISKLPILNFGTDFIKSKDIINNGKYMLNP